jgi:tight adherence protein C
MSNHIAGPDILLPSLAIFAAVVCAIYGASTFLLPDARRRRLAAGAAQTARVSVRKGGSSLERLAADSLGSKLAPTGQELTTLRLHLTHAGYDSPTAPAAYYGFRLMAAVGMAVLAVLLTPLVLSHKQASSMLFTVAVIAGVTGFMFPVFWVRQRKKSRQREISDGLASVLDLLLVCVEAGLGLDMAIARVGEEFVGTQPLLAEQLTQISSELRAGRPRAEAFRGFSERTGVPEVRSLVNLMIQSDQLGTSMANTLRVFAADMREHQLLRAEELAQKVSAKLSMVLVGCFLPALITAVIAPIIYGIIDTWKGVQF